MRAAPKSKNKKYLFEWERAIKKTPMDMVRKILKGVKKTLSGTVLRGLTLFFLPSGHLQTFNNLVTQKTLHFEERK